MLFCDKERKKMPTIRINDEIYEKLKEYELLESTVAGESVDRKQIIEKELTNYMLRNEKQMLKVKKAAKDLKIKIIDN